MKINLQKIPLNLGIMKNLEIPDDEVWFYEGELSNFYKCKKLIIDGIKYDHSEGYFQSQKFKGENATLVDLEYSRIVGSQNTGGKAASLARQKKPYQNYEWAKNLWKLIQDYQEKGVKLREDWDLVKDNVMRRAVYQKFSQNPSLKKTLIETGKKLLFEHTHRDDYWADGHPLKNPNVHGNGKNMLGIILEEIRYVLGGDLSPRYNFMLTFEYSNWIIPGLFLISGAPRKKQYEEFKSNGFRYIVSLIPLLQEKDLGIDYRPEKYKDIYLQDEDFCFVDDNTVVSRWAIEDREITSDSRALDITHTIIASIERQLPVVLHCFGGKGRAGTIACLVIGIIYGISGEESMEICKRLFQHRPNKGTKMVGNIIPQTKVQINQVKRILSVEPKYRNYNNFSWEPTHFSK